LFWAEADVNAVTEGPYLIDYVRFAYKRQVTTPEQAARVTAQLLGTDAIVLRDIAEELGGVIDMEIEPLPPGMDVPLINILDGLNCYALEHTLLSLDEQVAAEDARRGDEVSRRQDAEAARRGPSARPAKPMRQGGLKVKEIIKIPVEREEQEVYERVDWQKRLGFDPARLGVDIPSGVVDGEPIGLAEAAVIAHIRHRREQRRPAFLAVIEDVAFVGEAEVGEESARD
jgi:hypothetical protein